MLRAGETVIEQDKDEGCDTCSTPSVSSVRLTHTISIYYYTHTHTHTHTLTRTHAHTHTHTHTM